MPGVRSTHMSGTAAVNVDRSATQSAIYGSLSRDAQRYVDSVTAMGFDSSDVAAAVNRLGIDDKLVRTNVFWIYIG